MTETSDTTIGRPTRRDVHVGELKLRRFLAGEFLGAEQETIAAHTTVCGDCTRRLEEFAAEQRGFEERISFDRFAAGVERAVRVPGPVKGRHWWGRPATSRSFLTVISVGTLAAGFALFAGVRPLFESARARQEASVDAARTNRKKGGTIGGTIGGTMPAGVTFRIAPSAGGPQRTAATEAPEALALGERIRVGVQPGGHGFLFAISIDDRGMVTPLYPEVGSSLPVPRGGRLQYLPDSLELTGRGAERLVVLLTDQPLELDTVRRTATAAFAQAGGNLARLPNLALGGEQFHRTFLKP